jgi:hypothetical protein
MILSLHQDISSEKTTILNFSNKVEKIDMDFLK